MSSRRRCAASIIAGFHRQGDERAWWNKANIDPMPIALRFWQQTRGIPLAGDHKTKDLTTEISIGEMSGAARPNRSNALLSTGPEEPAMASDDRASGGLR